MLKGVRSKNLQNLLKIYFYTYVDRGQEKNPMISSCAKDYMEKKEWNMNSGARRPKILPGLRSIQRFLDCDRSTAQKYLRAIHIIHEIFVKCEKPLVRIRKKDHVLLLRFISYDFEAMTKFLGIQKPNVRKECNLAKARECLISAAGEIETRANGVFSPKDCAKIIRELASWLV